MHQWYYQKLFILKISIIHKILLYVHFPNGYINMMHFIINYFYYFQDLKSSF